MQATREQSPTTVVTRARRANRCQIRQGDVLLIPRRRPKRFQRLTEEEGNPVPELKIVGNNGHAHALESRVYESDGRTFLFLERPATLTHPEHAHVDVAAGWYEVRQQREREFVIRQRAD